MPPPAYTIEDFEHALIGSGPLANIWKEAPADLVLMLLAALKCIAADKSALLKIATTLDAVMLKSLSAKN